MVERLHTTPETEPVSRETTAIEAALDGFAPDGNSWSDAKATFEQSLENGRSYNQALSAAAAAVELGSARTGEAPESTPTEAEVRFWDNMDPNIEEGQGPTPAIERALDGYASDPHRWTLARDAFNDNIAAGSSVEAALRGSLAIAVDSAETHPEVARDHFYGGVDPDYADADHFAGRKRGIRISRGPAKIEIGLGRDVNAKRRRDLGNLAARHSQP